MGSLVRFAALFVAQFWLVRRIGTPWHVPVLATLGAALLLASAARRAGGVRIAASSLAVGVAVLLRYFLIVLMKLPEYAGPAQPGQRLPAFATGYADGRPFTDADLRDGSRRAMVFFRGRW